MAKHKVAYVGSALAVVLGSGLLASTGAYADVDTCVSAGALATEGFVANAAELEYVIQSGIAEMLCVVVSCKAQAVLLSRFGFGRWCYRCKAENQGQENG